MMMMDIDTNNHGINIHRQQKKHSCPMCRSEFNHFPAICIPLHQYIVSKFPNEFHKRELNIIHLEKKEYHAESPRIVVFDDNDDDDNNNDDAGGGVGVGSSGNTTVSSSSSSIADKIQCVFCKEVPYKSMVFTCGHIACAVVGDDDNEEMKAKCPVEGCVGTTGTRKDGFASSSSCHIIDQIVKETMSSKNKEEEYHHRLEQQQSKRCVESRRRHHQSVVQKNKASSIQQTKNECYIYQSGDFVMLTGLIRNTSFNGRRGLVMDYNIRTERYTIRLLRQRNSSVSASSSSQQNISVPSKNLRLHCLHYGVGCDGCGIYPIEGRRYKCKDCSEEIGFDLCGECYDCGVHKRDDFCGRFNQKHSAHHVMAEMKPGTVLQQFQSVNPYFCLHDVIGILENEGL